MAEEFRVLRPYEFHCQLISKGLRADGRRPEEFREIKLETDAITTANSSSLVKLGNTSLVCGCTTQLLELNENSHESGEVNIRLELPPICSNTTSHRTQHTAHLYSKLLKDMLNDMQCLDLDSLKISNNKSWSVDVEVICLNNDGCLLDAALVAVLSALKTLKLRGNGDHEVKEKDFIIKSIPICSSFALLGDHSICDPNLEEESIAQSTFSIAVDTHDDISTVHINKTGGKSINPSRLSECIQIAKRRALDVQKLVSSCKFNDKSVKMDFS